MKKKFSIFQYDVLNEQELNIEKIKKYCSNLNTDFLILPELSNVGYLFNSLEDLKIVSTSIKSSHFVDEILLLSKNINCTIVFGMAELDDDKIYNTACVVSKGKFIGKYRKIHLTDLERKFFSPGNKINIFEVDNVKFGIQICFDTRFNEMFRTQVYSNKANIIFVLANFGGDQTLKILETRALENQTTIVLANRIGHEQKNNIDAYFRGESCIFNSRGEKVIHFDNVKEGVKTIEIDLTNQYLNPICSNFNEEIDKHYKK